MSRTTGSTSTPNTKALGEILDQLAGDIESSTDGAVIINVDEARTIREALRWVCDFLNDRRLYHKKQQFKKRLIEKMVREKLSADEIASLNATAAKEAEQSFDTSDEEGTE